MTGLNVDDGLLHEMRHVVLTFKEAFERIELLLVWNLLEVFQVTPH